MGALIDHEKTIRHLTDHLTTLSVTIGERAMFSPKGLAAAAEYIESVYRRSGLDVEIEPYPCLDYTARNVTAHSRPAGVPSRTYLVGAHYDSVLGTVGADDNASSVAVQLEVARQLQAMRADREIPVSVKFVSFALEEYPSYGTDFMGSRIHAKGMKARGEKTDGMICLEMVGYTCDSPGCQKYPLPFMNRFYPKRGDFIGIVGNLRSRGLVRSLSESFQKNPELPVRTLMVPLNGWIVFSTRLSDHSSFWDRGFPAVMITDSAFFRNPHYHLPSDTIDILDLGFMARLVESLLIFFLP